MRHQPTIVFAGGGTGGHLSPGLAITEQIRQRSPDVQCIFACSSRAIDAAMLSDANVAFTPIGAMPLGLSPARAMAFLRGWRRAKREARELLATHDVRLVIAMGGFVAAPVMAVARAAEIPTLLLNLDAVPGKSNRLAARWSTRIVSTCPTPRHPAFDREHVSMPLRSCVIAPASAAVCRERLGLDAEMQTLVVTGASQGSTALNNLMMKIVAEHRDWLDGWQVLHIAGQSDVETLCRTYAEAGIPARVETFVKEIGCAWGAADLAITRAGANSVAEVIANAVPAIFFPYPHHADRHQFANAAPAERAGGAVVLEDLIDADRNLQRYGTTIQALLTQPGRRAEMRRSVRSLQTDNGASTIAAISLAMAKLTVPESDNAAKSDQGSPCSCATLEQSDASRA